MNRLTLTLLAVLAATPAWARDPAPKPSGITIHLFGPDSVTAGALPPTNGSSTTPAMGEVLHQMFVTGDPNTPPAARVSKGKTAN